MNYSSELKEAQENLCIKIVIDVLPNFVWVEILKNLANYFNMTEAKSEIITILLLFMYTGKQK